jgi:mono/diheme cytochrome c family protein
MNVRLIAALCLALPAAYVIHVNAADMSRKSVAVAAPAARMSPVGSKLEWSAQRRGGEGISFSNRIAPVLYANCVSCHRPGQAAPFSLISYDDVRRRGMLIARVTASRYMPPWHAEHGYGEFKDERRLTDEEIADIAAWVKDDMPQGDPSRMPAVPQFPEEWHLGKPDLVLEMAAPYQLPASGPDMFRNFVIPTGVMEDKWVRAIEIRPSAPKVVHHVLFAYDVTDGSRKRDGADGQPGSDSSMAPIGVGVGGSPNLGGLGGWAIGSPAFVMPDGHALRLPKGSDLILQTHFHLSGKPEAERSRVGIYFADKPETTLIDLTFPPLYGFGAGINISPGARDYTLDDSMTLPLEVDAYAVYAHAHYIGKEIKATATLPDGSSKPLIWIRDWDFNWQDPYIYKAPVRLPKGTRIDVRFVYDNSAENPRNPSSPPKAVMWGEETFDEMASLTILIAPTKKDEASALFDVLGDRRRAAIQRGVADGTLKRMQTRRTQAPAR